MDAKSLTRVEIKDADKGEVVAVFATLDVIDSDRDVTVKGAFETGAPVRISAYGHKSWEGLLPVGKGTIREIGQEAVMEGRFFLDTVAGRDTFTVVKELGDLQEWSYGYDVEDSEPGEVNGQNVRILKKLKVHEVSPVLLGAGVGTRTVSAKSFPKFEQHEEAVLAAVRGLHPRFDEVIAFRTEQGKSRLAGHSVEFLAQLEAEVKALLALRDAPANDTDSAEWAQALDLLAAAATIQGVNQ